MSQALGLSSGERDEGAPTPVNPPLEDDPILLLVRKIQGGKDVEKSCEELHKIFYQPVVAFFRKRGFPPEEVRDLTQEVFFRVFKGINSFQGKSRFESWLFKIAANVWKNELRRLDTEKRDGFEQSLDESPDHDDPGGRKIEPADSKPLAPDLMQIRERQELLREALQALPAQMRRVCELRFIQDRKYQEIADLLEVSIETIKAHLHQARKRLTGKLGSGDPPSGGQRAKS
jgi:RNA polymerase sigma-70 factor, ECF subfamily